MSNINLDEFDPKSTGQAVPTGETGLVLANQRQMPVASLGLSDIYSKLQKLLYVIDISGSMRAKVAGIEDPTVYQWLESEMNQLYDRIEEAVTRIAQEPAAFEDEAIADLEKRDIYSALDLKCSKEWASLKGLQGDALKIAVMKAGLDEALYLVKNDARFDARASKIALVRKMAKRMIEERVQKYPDADVECFAFNTEVDKIEFTTKEELVHRVGEISACGGTRIYKAVAAVMEFCKKRPSSINLHHIVLVTDGEDSSAVELTDLIPAMKAQGIVLDFIFIGRQSDRLDRTSNTITAIRKVTEATGGTYTEVFNAADFELKFIEASRRLLLPAPAEK